MTGIQATQLKCPSFVSTCLEVVKSNQKAFLKSFSKPLK